MTYDYKAKKIVAVLSSDLETWMALNVLGHLAVSIGAYSKDLMGRTQLIDASGAVHSGISKYPFIVTKLKSSKLKILIEQVKQQGSILIADYPEQMLTTQHDDELAQQLSSAKHEDLKYLGAIFYGDTEILQELTGKFSLWR